MKEPRGRRGSGLRAWKPSLSGAARLSWTLKGRVWLALRGGRDMFSAEGKEMYFLSSSRKYVILS